MGMVKMNKIGIKISLFLSCLICFFSFKAYAEKKKVSLPLLVQLKLKLEKEGISCLPSFLEQSSFKKELQKNSPVLKKMLSLIKKNTHFLIPSKYDRDPRAFFILFLKLRQGPHSGEARDTLRDIWIYNLPFYVRWWDKIKYYTRKMIPIPHHCFPIF